MGSEKRPRTKKWLADNVRRAQNAEMARIQMDHPTMLLLRSILEQRGRASRDSSWLSDKGKVEKLKRAMELIVEITSVAPPGSSSKTLR